jgi:hypothetical protein
MNTQEYGVLKVGSGVTAPHPDSNPDRKLTFLNLKSTRMFSKGFKKSITKMWK